MPTRSRIPIIPCPGAVRAAVLVQLVRRAPAVVLDQQPEAVVEVDQPDAGPGVGPAMLAGVRQGFLHHAVRGQLHAAGQRARGALDLEVDLQAGLPHLRDQVLDLFDVGLGNVLPALRGVTGPQHAEQPPHLRERLPAGAGDGLQGLLGLVGGRVHDVGGTVGLDDHHRHVVRDDVVQLAGDPGPLGGDGDLGLRLAFPLQAGGTLLQLVEVGAPGPQRVPQHPGQHERHGQR